MPKFKDQPSIAGTLAVKISALTTITAARERAFHECALHKRDLSPTELKIACDEQFSLHEKAQDLTQQIGLELNKLKIR